MKCCLLSSWTGVPAGRANVEMLFSTLLLQPLALAYIGSYQGRRPFWAHAVAACAPGAVWLLTADSYQSLTAAFTAYGALGARLALSLAWDCWNEREVYFWEKSVEFDAHGRRKR